MKLRNILLTGLIAAAAVMQISAFDFQREAQALSEDPHKANTVYIGMPMSDFHANFSGLANWKLVSDRGFGVNEFDQPLWAEVYERWDPEEKRVVETLTVGYIRERGVTPTVDSYTFTLYPDLDNISETLKVIYLNFLKRIGPDHHFRREEGRHKSDALHYFWVLDDRRYNWFGLTEADDKYKMMEFDHKIWVSRQWGPGQIRQLLWIEKEYKAGKKV